MPNLKAAVVYFALVFGTGFFLGAIRVPFLVPRLGVRTAELLEMPLMALAIVLAACHVVRRYAVPPVTALRLSVGFTALMLLATAELCLAVLFASQSPAQYIASRDPVSGSVYLAMLGLFALMPLILTRIRCGHGPR